LKDLRPGDVVRFKPYTMAHILEVHLRCNHRCIEIVPSGVAVVVSDPWEPEIEFPVKNEPYREVLVISSLGLCSMDCSGCQILQAPALAPFDGVEAL